MLRDTDKLACLTQVILGNGRGSIYRAICIEQPCVIGHGRIKNWLVGRESSKSELDMNFNGVTCPAATPYQLFSVSGNLEVG